MLGTQDVLLILIVALILFGPNKLPELARSLGKSIGEFKRAQMQSESELKQIDKPLPLENKDEKIYNLAVEMGLNVQNKSNEELIEEIRSKIRSNGILMNR
jgi:sec-independent protein translocase protein TatA